MNMELWVMLYDYWIIYFLLFWLLFVGELGIVFDKY